MCGADLLVHVVGRICKVVLGQLEDHRAQQQQSDQVGDRHGSVQRVRDVPDELDPSDIPREDGADQDGEAPDPPVREGGSNAKDELAPEIGFLDLGVGEKFFRPALKHEPAVLQYISSPGKLKRHSCILLDEKNGGAFLIDFLK